MTRTKQTPAPGKKRRQSAPQPPQRDLFTSICKADYGLTVEKEYIFHPTRKWRFDYAIPSHRIAIEIDGGVWVNGRHNRAQGYLNDLNKFNAAAAMGWVVLKFTPDQQYRRATFEVIQATIKNRENERDLEGHPQS